MSETDQSNEEFFRIIREPTPDSVIPRAKPKESSPPLNDDDGEEYLRDANTRLESIRQALKEENLTEEEFNQRLELAKRKLKLK